MAKYIHMMIRVLDENRSKTFYEDAFGFKSLSGEIMRIERLLRSGAA